MKEYIFPYSIVLGKLDEVHSSIEISFNEVMSKQLECSALQGKKVKLNKDDDINEIYDIVLSKIIKREQEAMLHNPNICEEMESTDGIDLTLPIEEQVSEYLENIEIIAYYPLELQNLPQKKSSKKSNNKYEYIILSRKDAEEFIKDKTRSKNAVVYVDEGKTLYWIYKNFTGELIIPENVKKIERNVFKDHKKITKVTLLADIDEISGGMFEGCEALESIDLSSSVKSICFNAFTKCSSLSSISMKKELESIDSTAFRFCSKLKKLVIPASVKEFDIVLVYYPSIGRRFSSIETIYFDGKDTDIKEAPFLDKDFYKNITFYGHTGSKIQNFCRDNNLKFELMD